MADPFVPDNVAPDLAPLYNWLAPDPDRQYGTMPWSPWSFNPEGSPAWVQNGPDTHLAMPAIVRDALAGILDLANSTHSGALTNRAIGTLLSNGAGAGGALAEKGALAAGGGRLLPPATDLAMDLDSRMARARAMGFDTTQRLYHGTNQIISPGFLLNPGSRTMAGPTSEIGVWLAENPQVAHEYADIAARLSGPREGFGQNIVPLLARSDRTGTVPLTADMTEREVAGALLDAWDNGYDAIRLLNYTTPGGVPGQTIWVFKNPNQLRSLFARFDPAKRDSADLLAARTSIPGFRPIPTTPGFRPLPNDRAHLPDFLRMMDEERVY